VAADFGYDRTGSYWTGPGRGWLAELDLPPVSREIVTDSLAFIDALAPVIERLDGELHQRAKADPRVKMLRTLPGVAAVRVRGRAGLGGQVPAAACRCPVALRAAAACAARCCVSRSSATASASAARRPINAI